MGKLYSFRINVNDLEIESHTSEHDEDDISPFVDSDLLTNRADFNDDGFEDIYAESTISAEDAERLAKEKAVELRDKFAAVALRLKAEN